VGFVSSSVANGFVGKVRAVALIDAVLHSYAVLGQQKRGFARLEESRIYTAESGTPQRQAL
jgi:hypothetical protein